MTKTVCRLAVNVVIGCAQLGLVSAASAQCQQGGFLDEHPKEDPAAHWVGPVTAASQTGLNTYTASWDSIDNAGGHSGRTLNIITNTDSDLTIEEAQSHQVWKGNYQRDNDGFIYFDAQGFLGNGQPLIMGGSRMVGKGCLKLL